MSTQLSKQELAKLIWDSAQNMRGSIEAARYKDYIFGFMFYKFLSEKEEKYLIEQGMPLEEMPNLTEEDTETVEDIQDHVGYFIEYKHLFSTWKELGQDFSIDNVRTALSAFNRNINKRNKNMFKVFDGIFDTMQANLKDLGNTDADQSKVARQLVSTIDKIPMDGKSDYDILGYVYEYLLSNFAAGAGKKAGEFYSPSEISRIISSVIADHHKNKETISVYDMAAGSSSLLITVGKAVSKHMNNPDGVKYYAQELITDTYNLARMNLIMKGVLPDNIIIRNGDTLDDDWPFFEDADKEGTYEPVWVDAVAANPPYSAHYDQSICDGDPRFDYGTAPASKADYAFLLHGLYHLKNDGVMGIILPHGVLFRGGEEEKIRTNLVEHHHIFAIVGLPAGIFYGTGIPTIIMFLRKNREESDILFVDASKEFEKQGKQNVLRARDIKKITDTVIGRVEIEKYSRIVTLDEIKANGYNLNIPRYVDSSEKPESYDIYASMFGGVPSKEIDEHKEYWDALPGLRDDLFEGADYCSLKNDNVSALIKGHDSVKSFVTSYADKFSDFEAFMKKELLDDPEKVPANSEEGVLTENIFKRFDGVPLADKYEAYQILAQNWSVISRDLELIQREGFAACNIVDPNMVTKKKNGKDVEVQEGWKGHILPFDIVQEQMLQDDLAALKEAEQKLSEIGSSYEEMIDQLSEEDKQRLLNDDNDAFAAKEVAAALKEVLDSVTTPETTVLEEYLTISKKKDKAAFIAAHKEIAWNEMTAGKDDTYPAAQVKKYIVDLKSKQKFEPGTYEEIVIKANNLIAEEKELKKAVKDKASALHIKTKETIESMSEEDAKKALFMKWIAPVANGILNIPAEIVNSFASEMNMLSKKYEITLDDIEKDIASTETELAGMLSQLTGSEYDMKGIEEFKKLLGGSDA